MKIHTLNTTPQVKTMTQFFENLPDEAAVVLVADRLDLAKNNHQPFTLEKFNWRRHQRGLCVGYTDGDEGIALFYIHESGLYAWSLRGLIHVVPQNPAICLISPPLAYGTSYWFSPSDIGEGHYKASILSTKSEIQRNYMARHPLQAPVATKKRKSKEVEEDGTTPVLHPIGTFSSGDGFGL